MTCKWIFWYWPWVSTRNIVLIFITYTYQFVCMCVLHFLLCEYYSVQNWRLSHEFATFYVCICIWVYLYVLLLWDCGVLNFTKGFDLLLWLAQIVSHGKRMRCSTKFFIWVLQENKALATSDPDKKEYYKHHYLSTNIHKC